MTTDGPGPRGIPFEDCYRFLFERSQDGILVTDPAGVIRVANPSGHRLLGRGPGELVDRPVTDLVDDPDRRGLTRLLAEAADATVPPRTWTLIRGDRRPVEVELTVQRMDSELVLWVLRDPGSHAEIVQRLRKISSQVPGVVYQYRLRPDGTSCFPYASERIREIYRVTPEEVREDASAVFAILHPDDYDGIVESITESARTLQPWQYEYRTRFPNGDVRWLYGNSLPERQPDGSVLWHGFITDVTDRKEAEQQQARLEAELRHAQRLESIGQLAGGVAHDFNNLLTSVLGSAELALSEVPAGSTAVRHLQRVVEAAGRGAALTQQLLAFARKRPVQPEPVVLDDVVRRIVPMIQRLLGEHYTVTLQLDSDAGVVTVDVGSLDQVIMNLAVNARDAMPGGGELTLSTDRESGDPSLTPGDGERAAQGFVVLGVRDTGTGMTPAVRRRLFEPFFITKGPGQGTGLGLSMCDGIVKQAGGYITVDSEEGRGSAFHVYLPLSDGVLAPRNAPGPRSDRGGHETILLVEDDPMIIDVARQALRTAGYNVLTARDGAAALDLAARTSPPIHLLLTDIVMPGMSGRDLARSLADTHAETRVLYVSGYAGDELTGEGMLDGDTPFLQKPYTPSELQRWVREVLDRG